MPNTLRFWFRGRVHDLDAVPPTLSVLHWLRDSGSSRGTKEGCNQGDCGACTVVLAELSATGVELHTANSCLLLMPMLHGRALFTVEDVGRDGLHPVQEAMVEHAGSQCGYCTPGFVMSMWCASERCALDGTAAQRDRLAEELTGNLCRCTGYRPILDAAITATDEVVRRGSSIDVADLATALAQLESRGLRGVGSGPGAFLAPASEADLARILAADPTARIVAGGTDLVLSMRLNGDDLRDDVTLVWTDRITGLSDISETDTHLCLGAASRLDDTWTALVDRLPTLRRMHQRFASPAIRAVGTIGGNIANGSPIADLTPVLLALDAELVLRHVGGTRRVDLGAFMTGLRTNVLAPGEFISRIDIPLAAFEQDLRSHKVSRRFDDDISTVSGTFALALQDGHVSHARIVFGGMATTVRRAHAAEAALLGREWSAQTLTEVQDALLADFVPITDHRASADYRMRAARGLLHRWWLETGLDAPAGPVDVWSVT